MRDFIYEVFAPTVGLFYWPFYPVTILLFIYIFYVLIKGKPLSKWMVFGSSLFSFLPSLLMILHAILEIIFVPGGYQFALIFLVTGVGVVINLISGILLMVYFFKHRHHSHVSKLETTR